MHSISVIIPYFQRMPGILRRALGSVFAQSMQDFHIIIVDDASPLPAEAELDGFSDQQRQRMQIIRQANSGPGGARNTGLDHVPDAAQMVAFLDSDDIWASEHLAAASAAMRQFDADCYFATIRGGTGFEYHSAIDALAAQQGFTEVSSAPLLLTAPDLASRMMQDWSYMHLSCMVLARPLFEKVRFAPDLRLAAEDVLFFHDCLSHSRRALLSAETGAIRGEGDNIFHGMDNQAADYVRQQFITLKALQRLAGRDGIRPADLDVLAQRQERARKEALWGQVTRLRGGKSVQIGQLAQWTRHDPALLRSLGQLVMAKLKRGS